MFGDKGSWIDMYVDSKRTWREVLEALDLRRGDPAKYPFIDAAAREGIENSLKKAQETLWQTPTVETKSPGERLREVIMQLKGCQKELQDARDEVARRRIQVATQHKEYAALEARYNALLQERTLPLPSRERRTLTVDPT